MSSTKKDQPAAVAPEPRSPLATAACAAEAPEPPPAIASEPASASEAAPVAAAPTSAPAPAPAATETSGAKDHASGSPAPADAQPPLTPGEFRAYNRIADVMNQFHEHFRQSWTFLYNACKSGRRPGNMTLRQFIDEGLQLASHIDMHHNIEETYLFPLLARKMPEFRSSAAAKAHGHGSSSSGASGSSSKKSGGKAGGKGATTEASVLLGQHQEIHVGMERFEDYLRACRRREIDFELGVLKEKMDSWGGVLWTHMDQEVETLRAENMRKYWTIDEIKKIPI